MKRIALALLSFSLLHCAAETPEQADVDVDVDVQTDTTETRETAQRKAGGSQQEYMVVKLNEVYVTSW